MHGNAARARGDTLVTGAVIDAAIRVHSALGPGLLESAYVACFAHELRARGLDVRTEVPLPLRYRGVTIDCAYRLDLVVEESVIVEVKASSKLLPVHQAQLLSYLRIAGLRVGLLINFHERHLRDGIKRLVNH